MSAFIAALAVGVAVAAPVGPVGLLCIQRTLRGGVASGLASGLGVATADGLYAALAALGLTWVSTVAQTLQTPLAAAGGALLIVLAYRAWPRSGDPETTAVAPDARGLAGLYLSALALTLANPQTILSFAAIMAGLGAAVAHPGDGWVFVAGIALGSAAWWVFLSLAVGLARARAPRALIMWAGRVSAVVLGMAGCAALVSAAMTVW